MKHLGIDYGEKRVGIAVSDENGLLASPRAVFPNNRSLVSDLAALIKKEGVQAIVVGESRGRSGEDNPIMERARRFARDLERETGLAVHFEPEFYTSREARRLTADTPQTLVDAEAAAIILSSFLSRAGRGGMYTGE